MIFDKPYKHPMWKHRRNREISKQPYCSKCKTEYPLQLHHKVYHRGHLYWEYLDHELEVLCKKCHTKIHKENHIDTFKSNKIQRNKHSLYGVRKKISKLRKNMIGKKPEFIVYKFVYFNKDKTFTKRDCFELSFYCKFTPKIIRSILLKKGLKFSNRNNNLYKELNWY